MRVLGISCFYHDAAAALIVDGQLVAACEEERFSRIKHDFNFPEKAIAFCLERAQITAKDLDLVVFYEKPFRKLDRILMSTLATWPKSMVAFREGMLVWLLDKLWVRDTIQERVGCERQKIVFCDHHVSHIASAYYSSGFDKAATLTVDGVGEWATGTRGSAWGNNIEVSDEMRYPHSLGLLYSAFTAFLGFQVNEGEYKVMGMAPYGKPIFAEEIFAKLVDLHDDGSFRLNMDYFAFHYSAYESFSPAFRRIFGRPRTMAESNLLDPHYADIAASIQKVAEEILVRQARYLHAKSGHDNLCMAGGTALNSVANARVFRESGFRRVFIQPAAGDNGGALGAALWGYHNVLGGTERFVMRHCYWGQEYHDYEIFEFLKQGGYEFTELPDMDAVYDHAVTRLEHGQVLGWMQGRFEWGPRALGARSILADPRSAHMKDIVNARIKFREPFRPFAPSVAAEAVERFFELPDALHADPARFMLMVVPVREECKSVIPAVTHVDGTSRIQAVHREDSPYYHELISRFGDVTGVPVVLNTSFNLRGEPIVNTPGEAYSTFARSDMDALIMGRFVVCRTKLGERRATPGAELEKWAHAPTRVEGTESRPEASAEVPAGDDMQQVSAARVMRGLQGTSSNYDDPVPSFRALLSQVLRSVLVAVLLIVVGAEIILRMLIPMTNMQVKNLYVEDKAGLHLRPHWSGRVHSKEFDVRVRIGEDGMRTMPALAEGVGTPLGEEVGSEPATASSPVATPGSSSPSAVNNSGRPEDKLEDEAAVSDSTPSPAENLEEDEEAGPSTDGFVGSVGEVPDELEPAHLPGLGNRILALGDSFTFGCWTDEQNTWLAGIQDVTGARVFNCGVPNAGTDSALSLLNGTKLQGNVVMLGFYTGNDFYDNMIGMGASTLKGGYLVLTPEASAKWSNYNCLATGNQVASYPGTVSNATQFLFRWTYLYQFIRGIVFSQFKGIRPSDGPAWFLQKYTPEMDKGVAATYDYLNKLKSLCEKRGCNFVMVIIPSALEVYDNDWQGWLAATHFSESLFDRHKPRRLILNWARANGVPVLDLQPYLAHRQRMYYYGDMHWNDLGHFQAGEVVSSFLEQCRVFDYFGSSDDSFRLKDSEIDRGRDDSESAAPPTTGVASPAAPGPSRTATPGAVSKEPVQPSPSPSPDIVSPDSLAQPDEEAPAGNSDDGEAIEGLPDDSADGEDTGDALLPDSTGQSF